MDTEIQVLERLLESIKAYQNKPAKYDEWQDTNPCAILTTIESPTFDPLFEAYTEIRSAITANRPALTRASQAIRLKAPKREVVFDDYGQQYVSYYFTAAHLDELAVAIRELLDALNP
jgi:hypothetical protein